MFLNISKHGLKTQVRTFRFKVTWLSLSVFLVAFLMLIGLGQWQIQRAQTKHNMIQHYQLSAHQYPKSLSELFKTSALKQYTPVEASGAFDWAHMMLLDHQYHRHQLGYHVIVPFKPKAQLDPVLVNLGWVHRSFDFKHYAQPKRSQTIQGQIYFVSPNPFITHTIPDKNDFPLVIQGLEIEKLSSKINQPFQPFIIRLDAKAPLGFERDWKPVVLSPSRHIFYAVQFFLFAFIALMIFVYIHSERTS